MVSRRVFLAAGVASAGVVGAAVCGVVAGPAVVAGLMQQPAPPPDSDGVVVGGWTHPLGGSSGWDTYAGGSHLLGAVDFPKPVGTPVFAACAGIVVHAGVQGTYGNAVTVHHADGSATHYAHLSEVLVGRFDRVGVGQVIGLVGSTGESTGPHLHFETRTTVARASGVPAHRFMRLKGINLGGCTGGACGLAGWAT